MKGAHNTLTAYRATALWSRLASFAWRCQRKEIPALIDQGIRLFDIRVCRRMDPEGNERWMGAHGPVTLEVSAMAWLLYINRTCLNTGATVRLILERGNADDRQAFVRFCRDAERYCPAIRFTGGRYKPTWQRLYLFCRDIPDGDIAQHVASMDPRPLRRLVGKICPRLWHRLWGAAAPDITAPYLLADFI